MADDILEGFVDEKTLKSNFSTMRVQNCVAELKVSRIPGHTERRSYEISLSREYENYIKTLEKMNSEFLFNHTKIRASDNKGDFNPWFDGFAAGLSQRSIRLG